MPFFSRLCHLGNRYIMVATGGPQSVQVYDVQSNRTCQNLPDFPRKIRDAVAGIVNQTPWICGGSLDNSGRASVNR